MRIPEIADRLRALAIQHRLPELQDLAAHLGRRTAFRRGKVTSVSMTPALSEEIRRYAAEHEDASQAEIGRHFGVNPGRVSEAIHGKRL